MPAHAILLGLWLLPFVSLPVCDTTSQCLGCRKKTRWTAWTSHTLQTHWLHSPNILTCESQHMQVLECFVVLLDRNGGGANSVNETRHHLFPTGQRSLDTIHLINQLYSIMSSQNSFKLVLLESGYYCSAKYSRLQWT